MSPIPVIAGLVASLAAIEGLSWLWMNPRSAHEDVIAITHHPAAATALTSGENSAVVTHLPDIYRKAAPMLRCSDGKVFMVETPDSLTLHLAFFEWERTDTGSVLEAFRHMPEICLGSIGMKLLSREKPVLHRIGGETLVFEHAVFTNNPSAASMLQPRVHSFRAVWVAGAGDDGLGSKAAGQGAGRLRGIRLKAALNRYRPPRACVIQGTVYGALHAGAAWAAFEETMLRELVVTR